MTPSIAATDGPSSATTLNALRGCGSALVAYFRPPFGARGGLGLTLFGAGRTAGLVTGLVAGLVAGLVFAGFALPVFFIAGRAAGAGAGRVRAWRMCASSYRVRTAALRTRRGAYTAWARTTRQCGHGRYHVR